jgi:hypothetical protein
MPVETDILANYANRFKQKTPAVINRQVLLKDDANNFKSCEKLINSAQNDSGE